MAHVHRAVEQGAEVLCGAKRPAHLARGFFLEPTILKVDPAVHSVWRDEVFGPVLAVCAFDTEADALRLANQRCAILNVAKIVNAQGLIDVFSSIGVLIPFLCLLDH